MTTEIDDGGPAFASPGHEGASGGWSYPSPGMSLRQYYAGEAIAAVVIAVGINLHVENGVKFAVDLAFEIADTMIKRGKR